MTTQQIQYIIALAEEGNFSSAAKKLYVTQPSISQLIKNMEAQIGSPLFDRTTTPVRLTTVGRAYYDVAKKIESLNRELENRVSEINHLKTGTLTIGTSPFRAACMLPQSISHFNSQYPGIKIKVTCDRTEKLKQNLMDGEIDICIDNDTFHAQLFNTEDLATETHYLAVNKSHPWNEGKEAFALTPDDIMSDSEKLYMDMSFSPKELMDLSFILLDSRNDSSDVSATIFEHLKIQPDISFYATNIETKFHWISSGLGAGFVPDTLIRFGNFMEHPYYYKIQTRKKSASLCQEKIVVAHSKHHFLTKAAKEYIFNLKKLISLGTWQIS